MRIWVLGDSGVSTAAPQSVYRGMQIFTERDGRPVDLMLHVGDIAYYDGTDSQFQDTFFNVYGATLRQAVCWPAPGNHETHSMDFKKGSGPYFDAFVLPTDGEAGGAASGTEAYYSFEHGDVHFVSLESTVTDRSPGGMMMRWLREDLEKKQGRWLIAYWHHPPYSKGRHDSDRERQMLDMRTTFLPVLEAQGVDLILSGHAHLYARSMLIDGAYGTPTTTTGVVIDGGDGNRGGDGAYIKEDGLTPHKGTVCVICGNGGHPLDREKASPVMKRAIAEYGSVIIDVSGNLLTGRMIDREGTVRDVFSIVKK